MQMPLPRSLRRRFITLGAGAAILLVAGVLQLAEANPAASQTASLMAWATDNDPGLDPAASGWDNATPLQVPLSAQAGVYAAGGGSIPTVWARALHYKDRLFVRVEWDDSTMDDSTTRVQDFADAVALEFPARSASSVPSICMGQANGGVNIWQWRADSQAGLIDPNVAYPNALVDGYPTDEDIFYTARAAGNPYSNPGGGPVQTLVAQAFGTLGPAATQDATGQGAYVNGKWAVVFSRPFVSSDVNEAGFTTSTRTDMAIAVWNGSEDERNGRKSVSQFVTLTISGSLARPGGNSTTPLLMAGGFLAAFVVLSIGLAAYGYRDVRKAR
jgi:hypothetical protein